MDNKRISEIVDEEMIKQDANRYRDMRKILTIPKSIADMLDEELNPLKRELMIETFVLGVNYLVLSDELMKFVITGDNYHIICAYLAGKALGVDLVKVVEG
ncbi:hypothetical protein [Lactococcus lactis]|uniref:hypothetical protein n=1 Tax=Lactococcus lactis TaxID=1358 RepID=UPI00071CAAE1|nr:hypothetical protein [Lactococcus lactis]KST98529.1 Phage protein [Lactococcus lactis subsp. lactis]